MRRGTLDIVFEDADLIVVNKPAGVLTVPLERRPERVSVFDQLVTYLRPFGKRRPLVVHRVDEDTSGIVVFAKHQRAQAIVQAQFKQREPARIYLAVVYGRPERDTGTWQDRLVWDEKALIQKASRGGEGTDAICDYRVVERFRGASLIEVSLVTGRRNQIRIQARLHGCPLIGEKRYTSDGVTPRQIRFSRHALHAFRLSFRHPEDGRPLTFEVPPPADFAALLNQLRVGPR